MKEIIISSQNKFIKMAASLKEKKYRDELNLFVVEGLRLVEEAAKSDWQLYGKMTEVKQPQGIMAIMKKYKYKLADSLVGVERPFFVVLDEVQDPGNVGTVIRTAAAAGCTGIFLTKGCADVFAAKVVRASMGSLFHVPIFENLTQEEVVDCLGKYEISILATSLESSTIYFQMDFNKPVAVVFGNEGTGVSRQLLEKSKERVHIPLLGDVESLNVASAAAVILYEAVRQRQ